MKGLMITYYVSLTENTELRVTWWIYSVMRIPASADTCRVWAGTQTSSLPTHSTDWLCLSCLCQNSPRKKWNTVRYQTQRPLRSGDTCA